MANDDGIKAKGLRALADEISKVADVYVVAPEGERSAMGHGISCRDKIYLEKCDFEGAVMAYKCSGTPADCVKLGIDFLGAMDIEMDFVVTGINHGGNLGTDTHYSGTVSAALEGVINRVSSIAVSVVSHDAKFFEYPARLAKDAVLGRFGSIPNDRMLNINVPNKPENEIRGIKFTKLGRRGYVDIFKRLPDEEGKLCYTYSGNPHHYGTHDDEVDVPAFEMGYATITPMWLDFTDHDMLSDIRKISHDPGADSQKNTVK